MNWFNLYAGVYDYFMNFFGFYKPQEILKHLQSKPSDVILDVGGGTGYISSKIKKESKKVIVLDDSKKMLDQAKKYSDLDLCHAKAQKIPFPDSYFDTVTCIDSLHHIKDIDVSLAEITRVLKKNGTILIYDFHIKGFQGFLFWLFEKIYIDNSKFITPNNLLKKMNDLNFDGRIVKVSKLEYIYLGTRR